MKFACLIVTNIGETLILSAPNPEEAKRICNAAMTMAPSRGFLRAHSIEILETIRPSIQPAQVTT